MYSTSPHSNTHKGDHQVTLESTLGSRIDQARSATGLSPSQLSRRIGVKRQTLENWETDRSEPRADKLLKLAGILQVPLIWLLTGETPDNTGRSLSHSETSGIAQKLERAISMQQELAAILIEISADVARLQKELDKELDLAA